MPEAEPVMAVLRTSHWARVAPADLGISAMTVLTSETAAKACSSVDLPDPYGPDTTDAVHRSSAVGVAAIAVASPE